LHPAKPVTIEQVKAYDKTLNISGRISSGVFLLGRVPTGFQTSGTPGPYIPDSHPPAWRACN
jgi:hypothetical protein